MTAIHWETLIKPGVRIVTVLVVSILAAGPSRGEGFALIVGVNDCPAFRLPDGSRPRPLQGAENDADALAGILIHQFGFASRNVVVLKGPEATRQEILSWFVRLAKQARVEDHFVFHYSGHGTQVPDVQPFDEPDGLDEALCPWDATANGEHLIRDDELALWLDDLSARRVTVILDCCHAGTGTKDAGDDPEIVSRFLPMRQVVHRPAAVKSPWRELKGDTKEFGRQMTSFFACQPDQEAYERRFLDRRPPHRAGQFSHFLIEGLRDHAADRNRDGIVSNGELLGFISRRLDESFNRNRPTPAGRQNPAIETSMIDGVVLVGPPAKAK
jgi:metacaspase-1